MKKSVKTIKKQLGPKLVLVFGEAVGAILSIWFLNLIGSFGGRIISESYTSWLPIASGLVIANSSLRMLQRVFDSRRWFAGLSFLINLIALISVYFVYAYNPFDFGAINQVAGWLYQIVLVAVAAAISLGMLLELLGLLFG